MAFYLGIFHSPSSHSLQVNKTWSASVLPPGHCLEGLLCCHQGMGARLPRQGGMCSQSRDVPCRPPAQLGTSHILHTQNKALSPSPPPCGCLPPGLFFTSAAQIWVPSPMPISFLPRALCFSSDYSLLCRWGKKKNSASATPMLPPTQEADGAFDSSHGSTLLYLLRADLYISNTCKLSPTANRPSLLILTSEGALLYFSINSPPPSTFSLPSQAPLSPS